MTGNPRPEYILFTFFPAYEPRKNSKKDQCIYRREQRADKTCHLEVDQTRKQTIWEQRKFKQDIAFGRTGSLFHFGGSTKGNFFAGYCLVKRHEDYSYVDRDE